MLLVKTRLDKSDIAGNGLFAAEDIPEGKVIWTFVDGFDRVYTKEEVRALPQQAQDYLKSYAFAEEGKIIFTADNDRYTNHSEIPNTQILDNGDVAAACFIPAGTEITADYRIFDQNWKEKL